MISAVKHAASIRNPEFNARQRSPSVITDVVAFCKNPIGKHPLSNRSATDRLAGLNTVEVLGRKHRVVFAARIEQGVGLIEVICAGPRTALGHPGPHRATV